MHVASAVRAAALAICIAQLAACASLTSGTHQSLDIDAAPGGAASCTLSNSKGSWALAATPGTVTVDRAYGDLHVACLRSDGATGAATVGSGIAPATLGNILLVGSVVWAAVDVSSGASFEYPSAITVTMPDRQVAELPLPVPPPAPNGPPQRDAAPAAPVLALADDARSRLRRLQEQRDARRLSEAEYHARVQAIVDKVGVPAKP